MKHLLTTIGVWAISASVAQAALMTTIQNVNPQRAGNTGIASFVAHDSSTGGIRLGDSNSFQTFCLETGHPATDGTFFVRIDTATDGGVSGHADDPISPATAYLYTTFRRNPSVLDAYLPGSASFTGTAEQQLRAVGYLQQAIWRLENESGGVANGLFMHALTSGWTDIGDVRVMQLWDTYNADTDTYGGARNDMLFIPSVIPSPESAMLGLIGLGVILSLGRRNTFLGF